jgi:tight adherence protein B
MMGPVDPMLLIGASSIALLGTGVCLYTLDRRSRARDRRVGGIVLPYAPAIAPRVKPVSRWAARGGAPGLVAGLLKDVLHIETARPDLYPTQWWLIAAIIAIVATVLTGAAAFFAGPVAWPALPLVWVALVRFAFSGYRNRRAAMLYAQLPDALAMIVRSVRSGIPVPEALRVVGEEGQYPTSAEFMRLSDDNRLGGSLPDALVKLAQRSSLIEYRFFAVALALQSQSGGSLTETLENLADVVRKRVALKQRAIALASEAVLTMYVLAALPFITAGALMVAAPDYFLVLLTTSAGKKVLFAGFVLLGLGIGSMKYIIKKSVS